MLMGIILYINTTGYITRNDVFDIFSTAQGGYNIFITVFLGILALALALFGYVIPRMINKNIKESEDRIKEDSIRNENRLNKELEHIRNENQRFQESIDERIINALNNKSDEIENKLTESLRGDLNKIYHDSLIFHNITSASISYMNGGYNESILAYLSAVSYCIDYNYYKFIKDINNYLINFKSKTFNFDYELFKKHFSLSYMDYKLKAIKLSNNKNELNKNLLELFETLEEVIKQNNN